MIIVQTALEAYWEGRQVSQEMEERLLYNLWKECRRWLKKKQDKPLKKQGELFQRRKLNIELLRDAAWQRLVDLSPRVAQALQGYGQGVVRNVPLQPLRPGYIRERQWYLNNGKPFGYSRSESEVHQKLGTLQGDRQGQKLQRGFGGRGFEDLTESDVNKLDRLYPLLPVMFKNKIDRLHDMVRIREDGLMADFDDNLISMTGRRNGKYVNHMYAMDQYGNLFVSDLLGNLMMYQKGTGYVETPGAFNHSSFLAGKDVLCAGCIHIGYDTVHQKLEPGVLSAIDNNSGHYKPTTENLQNCLIALADQGVDIRYVRVFDKSQYTRGGRIPCWWGEDFAFNNLQNPWIDDEHPGSGIVPPPNEVSL